MKKMMIYTKYKKIDVNKIISELSSAGDIIYLFSLFICGLIIGAALISVSYKLSIQINLLFSSEMSSFSIFLKNLLYGMIYMIINFYTGFNCFGIIISSVLPFVNGIYYGTILSMLISIQGFNGFVNFLLLEFPGALITSIGILLSSAITINMSKNITDISLYKNSNEIEVGKYIKNYLLLMIIVLVSATVSVITNLLFRNIEF